MKKLYCLFNFITGAGVLFILGTAGTADNTATELSAIIFRCIIGAELILVGAAGRCAVISITRYRARIKKRYKDNIRAAAAIMNLK